MAIRAPSLLRQTLTSARELLTTYYAIGKLITSTFQARLVPTLRARWPNAKSLAMDPNRWRSWQTWPLAQFPRLREARSLGVSLTHKLSTSFTRIETRYPPSCYYTLHSFITDFGLFIYTFLFVVFLGDP